MEERKNSRSQGLLPLSQCWFIEKVVAVCRIIMMYGINKRDYRKGVQHKKIVFIQSFWFAPHLNRIKLTNVN